MTFIIPNQQTKKIRQLNKGDLLGELFITKNIDLREQGKIKLSHATIATMTTDNDSAFSTADSMFSSETSLYLNSQELFDSATNNVTLDTFFSRTDQGDTNPPAPSVEEYGIYFNGKEVVSSGTSVRYRSAPTVWTTIGTVTLNSSYQTSMAVFDTFNSLLIANYNQILMIDTSWVTTRTLTIPSSYTIDSIAVNNNICYIATRHIAGLEAKLFVWDGTSTAWSGNYGVNTFEISSVKKYGGSVALITSKGKLLQFNGGGFDELAQLPIAFSDNIWGDTTNNNSVISSCGMVVDGEKIYIRLSSQLPTNINYYDSYFVSGTWCFTPDNGLYCIHTPTYTTVLKKSIDTSAVNITTNIITTTAVPITGTPVIYDAISSPSIGGLIDNKLYYTIKISSTEFKLATSLANSLAGTAIDLTGTGNAFQSFYFLLINDYGWSKANNRGAVEVVSGLAPNQLFAERLVFTADLGAKTNMSTKKTVFNVVNPQLHNRGYFILPKLNSSNNEDNYNLFSIKYKPLKEEDSILIKSRTRNRLNLPFNSISNTTANVGTWVDTNTFTTTLDMTDAIVGDEIEIIAGVGSGFLSHIESLSNNAGTWTINMTDSFMFAVANDTMYFSVDNWTLIKTITSINSTGVDYDEFNIDDYSKFIQFKIELRGTDVTIEELQVKNSKSK